MTGSDFPFHLFTKVHRFFEKTNKITTNYQNLELSDPWRLYVAWCPKRNSDFWRELLKALNIPIYIGSFRAGSECSRAIRAYALFALLCPVSGRFGVLLDSLMRITPREGRKCPSLAPWLPATTSTTRADTTRGQDRTEHHHHHHRQPEITRSPQRQPEGNLESF